MLKNFFWYFFYLFLLTHFPATTYVVSVKTGDVRGAGTDSNVFLKIFGTKEDTGTLQLRQSENAWDKFERNRTDQFKLEATDIGKVSTVVSHRLSAWWLGGTDYCVLIQRLYISYKNKVAVHPYVFIIHVLNYRK